MSFHSKTLNIVIYYANKFEATQMTNKFGMIKQITLYVFDGML